MREGGREGGRERGREGGREKNICRKREREKEREGGEGKGMERLATHIFLLWREPKNIQSFLDSGKVLAVVDGGHPGGLTLRGRGGEGRRAGGQEAKGKGGGKGREEGS